MENASKALIIAGAILLAILIIGLGVFIYNQASNTVGETGMDQAAVRQFNGQFEPYINKTIDSTAAKALIDTVNSSNNTGKNLVRLPEISNKSQIQTGHKYNVEAYQPDGVINEIIITDTITSASTGGSNGLQEIDPESFNEQFVGYMHVPPLEDAIRHADGETANFNITPQQTAELRDLLERSNKTYSKQIEYTKIKIAEDVLNYNVRSVYGKDGYLYRVIIEEGDIESIVEEKK